MGELLEGEPLAGDVAKRLIGEILEGGIYSLSRHAEEELAKDNMSGMDAVNVLRAGRIYKPAEFTKGSWRYVMETPRMAIVVAFRSKTEFVVVTGWRKKNP